MTDVKYLLPKELGGGEVEHYRDGLDPDVWIVQVIGTDIRITISREHLAPVVPPTPAEPPPGAYQIGETVCFRPAAAKGDVCWVASTDVIWWDWPMFWERNGGPDLSIRPLVALPAVELPWSWGTGTHAVLVNRAGEVSVRVGSNFLDFRDAPKTEMAAALWTAAGDQP